MYRVASLVQYRVAAFVFFGACGFVVCTTWPAARLAGQTRAVQVHMEVLGVAIILMPKGLDAEGGVVFFAQLGIGFFLLLGGGFFGVGHADIDFIAGAQFSRTAMYSLCL